MAQYSRPWEFGVGDGIGAAADGSYTAEQWMARDHASQAAGDADYGVLWGYQNSLVGAPTAIPSTSMTIGTGAAWVAGIYYENDSALTFPAGGFPAPVANPRIDRVVLRATWATRTVRVHRIAGAENPVPVPPALTQVAGVTWDIPLYQVYFAFPWAGVVAYSDLTDERCMIQPRQRTFDAYVGTLPGDFATIYAALAAGHRSIFIRAGTTTEPGIVTVPSGTWLCGENRDNTIVDMGAFYLYVNEIAPDYADNVRIEGLTITGTDTTGVLQLDRARSCIVRDCLFPGDGQGLYTSANASQCEVASCDFTGATGLLSPLEMHGDHHKVAHCHFDGNGWSVTLYGDKIMMDNCSFTSGSAGAGALLIAGTSCSVENCTITGALAHGIVVQEDYARLIGNAISDCGGDGIYIAGAGTQFTVISGNTIYACTQSGIYIQMTAVVVNGNAIHSNGNHGIEVALGAGDYSSISGNIIHDNGADGIDILGGCDRIIVNGNQCINNGGWGIDYAGDRDIVTDNICLGNTAGQIDPTGATNQVQVDNITV